jgi:hypothetical protein
MNFKDFKDNPQDLIGKFVLYESGISYSNNNKRSLIKIQKVTKTGFKLYLMPDHLFNLYDGSQKGLGGRMNMAIISQCTLLTDEEVNNYRETWRKNKEEKTLREEMKLKFDAFTFEDLLKMKRLL